MCNTKYLVMQKQVQQEEKALGLLKAIPMLLWE